jgi:mRNA interferase MazF
VKRGDLYRVRKPGGDAKRARAFVVVSRPALIRSRFSTVVCAPVYSQRHGLATEVPVGSERGLAHHSSVPCDALVSIPKSTLTDFVGLLSPALLVDLDRALHIAVHVE